MSNTKVVENEVFAIRNGERTTIVAEQPTSGRWLAVMARSVSMPPGERHPFRHSDQMAVEQAAIVACQMVDGKWQWVQLSPPSKEAIGDLIFDSNADKDRWYFVTFANT